MTSTSSPSLEEQLFALLGAQETITVGTAESCTGGNVAHHITRIAGSSAYFLGGIVSYANSVKRGVLGVPEEILRHPGAVSEPCARAMAEGARRVLGTTLAVATTGIAGPVSSDGQPVGTVHIAVSTPLGSRVESLLLKGDRDEIRTAAAARAITLAVDAL